MVTGPDAKLYDGAVSRTDFTFRVQGQIHFKLMLEDRSISLWAYNLETVLAEKLESAISRATTNTRMRDFYDIYILSRTYQYTASLF